MADNKATVDNKTQVQTQEQKDTQKAQGGGKGAGTGGTSFNFKFQENPQFDEEMRRPRSQAYLEIVSLIDLTSSTDEEIMEQLRQVVDEDTLEEFADMTVEDILEELRLTFQEEMAARQVKFADLPEELQGVISQCYISGCVVHAIDQNGMILDHYTASGAIPDNLKYARALYQKIHGKCRCIEAYNFTCRIIAEDGSVTKVKNEDI